jgi:oligopeptide/dipeptide ABC transporter ATP-binding protein
VVYAGEIVEDAPARDLFARPAHPYTRLLLEAMPTPRQKVAKLPVIAGSLPGPNALPPGCRFHPRCPDAIPRCRDEVPAALSVAAGRLARCWRAEELLAAMESVP